MRRQRGFTLIESLTTLSLVGVFATLSMPGLQDVLQRRRTEGVAGELATDLQFVRSEAVARNQILRVAFSALPDGGSCYVLHSGPAAACTCAADGPAVCRGDAEAIKTVALPNSARATVQANVASIAYEPRHGTSTPAATIRVTGRDGRAVHHVVNVLGRVRSCAPPGGLPGYRAC